MNLRLRLFPILTTLTIAICSTAVAQDWPQWRGPARSGTTTFKPPSVWPDRPKQVWKAQAGEGHSSPVVANGRVYLFSRVGDQEAITSWDVATGKQLWRQTYDAPYEMNPAARSHGKGPKSTPVYDQGRIYTFGISGILSAWQADGSRLLWRKDFKKEFPATSPDFGVAMSPLVLENVLIVHAGGKGNGAVMGLDAATGAAKWAWKGDGPAYASPVVATFAGTRQVITQSQRRVIGLSTAGQLLWEIPLTTEYEQNSVTPIAAGDLLVYGGLNKPTTAIRVTQSGGKWRTEEAWQNADMPMYMSSPVVAGGYLYGLTHRNRGQFFCLDASTGKMMWTTKGREGENASLVSTNALLMGVTTEGVLVVARANPKQFEEVKRYTIAESPVWAHPAIVSNGILIKDADTLAYWTF